jgi:hypothetical protein
MWNYIAKPFQGMISIKPSQRNMAEAIPNAMISG